MFPRSLFLLLAALCVVAAEGCSTGGPTAEPDPPSDTRPGTERAEEPERSSTRRVRVTVQGEVFTGLLDDSVASRDLLAQLPLSVTLQDLHGVEKAGKLPRPLSTEGKPAGADPDVDDIGYYAPWQNLVLYYGDQGYYDGIVVLGHMKAGAERRLARLTGDVQVEVDRADG